VEVQPQGFRKFASKPFRVEARETKRINATLAIGSVIRRGYSIVESSTYGLNISLIACRHDF